MHEILQVILLGIIEGLTEFIPVSSTGHLVLLSNWIGFEGGNHGTFEIFIQLGAILAVVVLYSERFFGLLDFKGNNANAEFRGLKGLFRLALVSAPIMVVGLVFYDQIKALMRPETVAVALIVGGVLMILLDRATRQVRFDRVEQLTPQRCLFIGIFQCLALWPGMSRSGSTIIGGLILGCHRKLAAEFSFLAAVPVMVAAVGYELYKSASTLTSADILPFAVGFIVSFIVAIAAVKTFIKLLGSMTLRPFGYYRIALGVLVLALV